MVTLIKNKYNYYFLYHKVKIGKSPIGNYTIKLEHLFTKEVWYTLYSSKEKPVVRDIIVLNIFNYLIFTPFAFLYSLTYVIIDVLTKFYIQAFKRVDNNVLTSGYISLFLSAIGFIAVIIWILWVFFNLKLWI